MADVKLEPGWLRKDVERAAARAEELGLPIGCRHYSYTQDRVTGECTCDQCGKVLIDCLGNVRE